MTSFSTSVLKLCGNLRLGEKLRRFMELYNRSDETEQLSVQWRIGPPSNLALARWDGWSVVLQLSD